MTPLSSAQLNALHCLRAAYPNTRIAIVGAAALGFHIKLTWRITADMDLVLALAALDLDASKLPGWRKDEHQQQRWLAPDGVVVDLVPTSPEALARGHMLWSETGTTMNVAGIKLALDSETSRLDPQLSIGVPSVPVIALLKMAAFGDRPFEREKDLKDLAHVLNEYPPLSDDRLYSDEILNTGFDAGQAQAFALGREMKEICGPLERTTVDAFLALVNQDVHRSRFVSHSPWRYKEENLERRLRAFQDGFREISSTPS